MRWPAHSVCGRRSGRGATAGRAAPFLCAFVYCTQRIARRTSKHACAGRLRGAAQACHREDVAPTLQWALGRGPRSHWLTRHGLSPHACASRHSAAPTDWQSWLRQRRNCGAKQRRAVHQGGAVRAGSWDTGRLIVELLQGVLPLDGDAAMAHEFLDSKLLGGVAQKRKADA